MVCREPIRSLRAASCCSVEVVNGAAGLRVYGLVSTSSTENAAGSRACTQARASSSPSWTTSPRPRSAPRSSKSRPVATRTPPSETRRASNGASSADPASVSANVPLTSQYSASRNAIRSRSRSTTMRVATDCTRPADRP